MDPTGSGGDKAASWWHRTAPWGRPGHGRRGVLVLCAPDLMQTPGFPFQGVRAVTRCHSWGLLQLPQLVGGRAAVSQRARPSPSPRGHTLSRGPGVGGSGPAPPGRPSYLLGLCATSSFCPAVPRDTDVWTGPRDQAPCSSGQGGTRDLRPQKGTCSLVVACYCAARCACRIQRVNTCHRNTNWDETTLRPAERSAAKVLSQAAATYPTPPPGLLAPTGWPPTTCAVPPAFAGAAPSLAERPCPAPCGPGPLSQPHSMSVLPRDSLSPNRHLPGPSWRRVCARGRAHAAERHRATSGCAGPGGTGTGLLLTPGALTASPCRVPGYREE